MRRDNDEPQEPWEEQVEDTNSHSPRPQRQARSPQRARNPRPRYKADDDYSRQTRPRSRPTRRSREDYLETDSRTSAPRPRQYEEDASPRRYYSHNRRDYLEPDTMLGRRDYYGRRPPRRRETRQLPEARRRSVWPWLLLGCMGGIFLVGLAAAIFVASAFHIVPGKSLPGILNQKTYTKSNQQTLSIPAFSQMQVHNQVGDISITLDGNATTSTITTVKKVKAASQDDANKEFDRIAVQIQPDSTPTNTFAVTGTIPDQTNNSDSVDIAIVLPFSAVSSTPPTGSSPAASQTTFDIATSVGNITVDGLSGVLSIKDDTGNITAQHVKLSTGSHIQAGTGNVTFNGSLDTTASTTNTPSQFKLQSEIGKMDVTLPAQTAVTLDANVNVGKINTDFGITVQPNNGAPTYYGPLDTSAATPPTAVLALDVSTGDINLHKGI